MDGSLSWNSTSLQTFDPATRTGIVANLIDHTDGPDTNFELFEVANSNRSVPGDIDSPKKIIPVGGVIAGSSIVDLAQRIDAFKALFIKKNGNLDINYAGSTRRYVATAPLGNIKIKVDGKKLFAKFTMQFVAEPFGRDLSLTTFMTVTGRTTIPYNATGTIGGSAPYQKPIITITVTALTGSGDSVQVTNNLTGQSVLIYGKGIVNGDVIKLDSEKQEVRINNVLVDYVGRLFELEPGPFDVSYTDGFTTRTVNILGQYYKRYS